MKTYTLRSVRLYQVRPGFLVKDRQGRYATVKHVDRNVLRDDVVITTTDGHREAADGDSKIEALVPN